jgi:lipooligosaccharide transport system ATP-binding protein
MSVRVRSVRFKGACGLRESLIATRRLAHRVEAAVVARTLVKRYAALEAVRGIDFDVPAGSVFGFLGPNGAGKTSTMRMIYGLSPRTSGRLDVLGLDVATHGREVKRRIGVVPQEANLDADMTARENLTSYGRFFDVTGAKLRDRVDGLLSYVQLEEKADVVVNDLSGGMKRRLLIARALVNDPELLVLDEPTTGLDPQSRALLWEKIRDLKREGRTVLLTTHYMEEAEKLADELVIMDNGEIIERGAPKDLVAKHVGREVLEVAVDASEDKRIVERVAPLAHERVGGELRLFGQSGDEMLSRAGIHGAPHLVRRATLEDVFLKLTGRRLTE